MLPKTKKPVAHLRCDRTLVPDIKAMAAFHGITLQEMTDRIIIRGISVIGGTRKI